MIMQFVKANVIKGGTELWYDEMRADLCGFEIDFTLCFFYLTFVKLEHEFINLKAFEI